MGAAYGIDLRQRIIDAYLRGEGSQEGLAEQLAVAPNTVLNYLDRLRSTGNARPLPHGGGKPPRVDSDHEPGEPARRVHCTYPSSGSPIRARPGFRSSPQ